MMIVADKDVSLLLSGTGDVIESDDGILAIGSGGPYANSAAKALMKNTKTNQFVKGFELILLFDVFLQKCDLRVENVSKINEFVNTFMDTCKKTFKRGGNGACLIKNHLFFHLQKCIEMFGPPSGWDSAPCEAHHKSDIKAPSLITQRNASSLIQQTCLQKMEHLALKRAMKSITRHDNAAAPNVKQVKHVAGSKHVLHFDNNGKPVMRWLSHSNKKKPCLPDLSLIHI